MSPLLMFLLSIPFLIILGFYINFKMNSSKYWSKRKVPHADPVFMLGNMWRAGILENVNETTTAWHLKHKKKKIYGFWMFTKPMLFVMDLEIAKRILIKDFNNFRDRGLEINTELDPLAGHLFLLSGKMWRNLRVKLTPTFTSGKMKLMFPTMANCGHELQRHLLKSADTKQPVEVKDLLARFTTDVISSCAFGIETNSMQNPKSEFREFGKKIFKFELRTMITNILFFMYPKLQTALRIRLIPKDVSDFFLNAVKDTIEYREKNNTTRNDFLQLLIQLMKAGKLEDADKTPVDELTEDEIVTKFSLNEAAAQCFVFFAAGFETSSTALTFGLYELALSPDMQSKLQKDIDEALENSNNEICYDAMCKMEYLDMFVQETLRKYPPVGSLQRVAVNDYYIPELNTTIEKGTTVMFAVCGIHNDPDIYPNPERFDPERFTPEEKSKRDAMAYLPFGEGPRNCIGNRFALMQIKVALISILKDYNVEVCKDTPIPLVYEVRSFLPHPKGGMPLLFTKRN